jgi:hypothetical protein
VDAARSEGRTLSQIRSVAKPRGRAVMVMLSAGVLVGIALAVGLVIWIASKDADTPSRPVVRIEHRAPETHEAIARAPSVAPVRLSLDAEPRGAELMLDGAVIANPFDGMLAPSARPHRIDARLEGYRPLVQQIELRSAQRIHLVLEPNAQAHPTPPRRRTRAAIAPRPTIVPLAPSPGRRTIRGRPRMSSDEI